MTRVAHPPQEFEEERQHVLTTFRCEKCTCRYPNTPQFLVIQDGVRLCRPNCAFNHSPSEWDSIAANAIRDANLMDSDYVKAYTGKLAEARDWSLMDGVSVLTDITFVVGGNPVAYPSPVPLAPGGDGVPITGSGVGLVSTNTLTFSTPDVSATAPSVSSDQTSFTSTLSASPLCARGDYDLLFDSNVWRNAVRVR